VLQKIQAGKPITDAELRKLAALLARENPEITEEHLRRAYDHRTAHFIQFIRHILGLERLESWPATVSRAFTEFIAAHTTLTAIQIQFLRTLETYILQTGKLERRRWWKIRSPACIRTASAVCSRRQKSMRCCGSRSAWWHNSNDNHGLHRSHGNRRSDATTRWLPSSIRVFRVFRGSFFSGAAMLTPALRSKVDASGTSSGPAASPTRSPPSSRSATCCSCAAWTPTNRRPRKTRSG